MPSRPAEPTRLVRRVGASILIWVSIPGLSLAHQAAEEYAEDLGSSVASVRENAAISLGRLGERSAVPALIEALSDKESSVRREAAKALGFIKDQRALSALIEALSDRDTNVRVYAAYALGEIKDPKAAAALLRALGDPAWCVRDQAAWALREIRDPGIARPLAAALKQEHADLAASSGQRRGPDRAHVMWLLRHLEGTHAVGPLAALLRDRDPKVRLRAVGALRGLGGGKGAVEPIIAALEDSDPDVRLLAIEALVEVRDDRARKPLRELAERAQTAAVREAARKAHALLSRHEALAAHWSFDDRDTRVARDVTGRGADGQIRGCKPVEGKLGHALQFGEGRYIELGNPAGLTIANRPFTVAAWAKPSSPTGVVVARGGAFCGFSLYVKDGCPKFGIHRVQDGPAYIATRPTGAAGQEKVVGSWVHLAGVVRKDRIELFVNGKLAATAKTPGYIPSECGQGMEIGFDVGNSSAEITDPFEGIIDEVKVFGAALSADEIAKEARSAQSFDVLNDPEALDG